MSAQRSLKIITSWDDGLLGDLRIADLLRSYGLPGIFFIPSRCELTAGQIKALGAEFTLGGHTETHPEDLKRLSAVGQYREIKENKNKLEALVEREIDWFAFPSGRGDQTTCEQVRNAGFKYARKTVIGHVEDFRPGNLQIATTCHAAGRRKEYMHSTDWFSYALIMAQQVASMGGVFHIWGHANEIEQYRQWQKLESFLKYLSGYKIIPHESLYTTN